MSKGINKLLQVVLAILKKKNPREYQNTLQCNKYVKLFTIVPSCGKISKFGVYSSDRKATTNKQANKHHWPMKGEWRAKANSLKTDQKPFILFPAWLGHSYLWIPGFRLHIDSLAINSSCLLASYFVSKPIFIQVLNGKKMKGFSWSITYEKHLCKLVKVQGGKIINKIILINASN